MAEPRLTTSLQEVAAAVSRPGLLGLRLWSFAGLSGGWTPTVEIVQRELRVVLTSDPDGTESITIRLQLHDAALWSGAAVIAGQVEPIEWPKAPPDSWRDFIGGGHHHERRRGVWFPDLELRWVDQGFRWAVPSAVPSLISWLPPSADQFSGLGMESLVAQFNALLDRTKRAGAAPANVVAYGTALARRGSRDLVLEQISRLCSTIPEYAVLNAWLSFFSDHRRASVQYTSAVDAIADHPRTTMRRRDQLLAWWAGETQLARTLGLIPNA